MGMNFANDVRQFSHTFVDLFIQLCDLLQPLEG